MARWRSLVIIVALLLALFSLLRIDIPEGLSSPMTYRTMVAGFRIITLMGKASKVFGFTKSGAEFVKKLEIPMPTPVTYAHIKSEDVKFDGVPVRIYRKPGNILSDNPALLFFHGGGFAILSVDMYDDVARHITHHTNTVVVSVEYSLSLDRPYPAAIDECVKAYQYLVTNAHLYGVDSRRIGVAGDSAGGNLATTLSLRLRDIQFMPAPHYQVLIYPLTQVLDFHTPSHQHYIQSGAITAEMAAEFLSLYMFGYVSYANEIELNNHITKEVKIKYGNTFINHRDVPHNLIHTSYKPPTLTEGNTQLWDLTKHLTLSSYVSPLIARDLSEMPAGYIITCEGDGLRDDGILYYQRLKSSGNNVTHKHYMACFHGVLNLWQIFKEGEDILKDVEQFIIRNK